MEKPFCEVVVVPTSSAMSTESWGGGVPPTEPLGETVAGKQSAPSGDDHGWSSCTVQQRPVFNFESEDPRRARAGDETGRVNDRRSTGHGAGVRPTLCSATINATRRRTCSTGSMSSSRRNPGIDRERLGIEERQLTAGSSTVARLDHRRTQDLQGAIRVAGR